MSQSPLIRMGISVDPTEIACSVKKTGKYPCQCPFEKLLPSTLYINFGNFLISCKSYIREKYECGDMQIQQQQQQQQHANMEYYIIAKNGIL
jgi:hypothetical protein